MIRDQEIITALACLAEREGITKAEALRRALEAVEATLPVLDGEDVFPRELVEYRTYTL